MLNFDLKIESVKVSIFPGVLCLFQILLIEITDQQFNKWDKLISQHIWQGRKPRPRFETLKLAKNKVGLQ